MRLKLIVGFLAVLAIGLTTFHFLPIVDIQKKKFANDSWQSISEEDLQHEKLPTPDSEETQTDVLARANSAETATFGSGCFWCTEALFQQLKGVRNVVPGYSGGSVENPTYKQICTGTTGHAEVVQVTFDPKVVTYSELLEVFWQTHDPTTVNRQGHDVGTQYRSVIFYHSDRQHQLSERYRQKIDAAHVFSKPLVTEIAQFTAFYRAEDYHQNYYANHPELPYCRTMIGPKLEKLKKVFQDKLRTE
jgi:peptide-methionine (S)-S-oxide reductase